MGLFGRDTVTVAFRTAPFLAFLVLGFVGFQFCLTILEQNFPQTKRKLDIQGHRGGRGDAIENTLPSFAWGLMNGATTLELDNGITKDGIVVVWHDQSITSEKCQDTSPVIEGDPDFPYVGKFVVNLTLAQIRTLDCGSKRLNEFPLQLTYPGTRISTLKEVFAFARCADPERKIQWNIESKINASYPVVTHGVDMFVARGIHSKFVSTFSNHGEGMLDSLLLNLMWRQYQSLDWRTLIAMKKLDSRIRTSALISHITAVMADNSTSPWQAGIRLEDMPGLSLDVKIANAAHSIKADILSPQAMTPVPEPFTTQAMVDKARELNMQVIPWTVNKLSLVERLAEWKVDGVITDYPNAVRRWAKQNGYKTGAKYEEARVLECLQMHLRTVYQTRNGTEWIN